MGRVVDFHKRNFCAIAVQSFFVLAFVGGYIAFLTTFFAQNRDQVLPCSSPSLSFPLLLLPLLQCARLTLDHHLCQTQAAYFEPLHSSGEVVTLSVAVVCTHTHHVDLPTHH
jgi:hypothetical protein